MQQRVLYSLIAVLSLVSLVGCGKDDKDAEANGVNGANITTGAYSFVVNHCDTGTHSYRSQAQYCQMLLDDELNHYCATDERAQRYRESCQTSRPSMNPTERPIERPIDLPGSGKYQFRLKDCDTGEHRYSSKEEYCKMLLDNELNNKCANWSREQAYRRDCDPSERSAFSTPSEKDFPKELTILGKLAPKLEVRTSEEDGSVNTTLDGTFTTNYDGFYNVDLAYADKIEFVGMPAECVLSVKYFSTLLPRQQTIQFTLSGIDSKQISTTDKSCAVALQNYAKKGFQARFLGATLMHPNFPYHRATVSLSVF